jgi:RNA polymerase-binding transcription factor DksA
MTAARVRPRPAQITSPRLDPYRALLEEQWRGQVAEITRLALEAFAPRHLALGSDDGRAEELNVLARMRGAVRQQLAETDAALRRLEDGSFGICVHCRRPIPADRLDVLPAVSCCVACRLQPDALLVVDDQRAP